MRSTSSWSVVRFDDSKIRSSIWQDKKPSSFSDKKYKLIYNVNRNDKKQTGKMNVKVSTGSELDLQDTDNPFTILSKRPSYVFPALSTDGRKSDEASTSSMAIKRRAVAISRAQLHSGWTVHLASFTMFSKAASPTIWDRSKGSKNLAWERKV